jgi:hypothetical protein
MALSPKDQKENVYKMLKNARAKDVIENRLKVSLTHKKRATDLHSIVALNNITYVKGKKRFFIRIKH